MRCSRSSSSRTAYKLRCSSKVCWGSTPRHISARKSQTHHLRRRRPPDTHLQLRKREKCQNISTLWVDSIKTLFLVRLKISYTPRSVKYRAAFLPGNQDFRKIISTEFYSLNLLNAIRNQEKEDQKWMLLCHHPSTINETDTETKWNVVIILHVINMTCSIIMMH